MTIMAQLTAREREVLSLLMQGRGYKEISAELCISRSTLKTHLRHVRDKAGAKTTLELAIKAAREGE